MKASIEAEFKPKLLIVDDEKQLCIVLKDAFSKDFEIQVASNGAEALQVAHSWQPEVILMDAMMPVMSGIDACNILRKDEATRHIPVVMLTAVNISEYRMKAFDFGVDDYIVKPFELDEVLIRLKSKVRRAKEMIGAQL